METIMREAMGLRLRSDGAGARRCGGDKEQG